MVILAPTKKWFKASLQKDVPAVQIWWLQAIQKRNQGKNLTQGKTLMKKQNRSSSFYNL